MPPWNKRSIAILGAACVCLASTIAAGLQQGDEMLVFEHVNVVRVQDGSIARDVSLAVTGDRVIALTGEQDRPRTARRVDARGWYAIPGLWDMHVHLNEDAAWALPLAAAAGVTGMRDMGGGLDAIEPLRVAASAPGLPHVLVSGPIVTGVVADDDPRIWQLKSPAEAARAVERLAAARVDHLKVHDWLTRAAWRRVADEARTRGLPVVGHVPVHVDALEAARRQKSIEHLGNAWGGLLLDASTREATFKRELRRHMSRSRGPQKLAAFFTPARWQAIVDSYSTDKASALARAFARQGTFVCPTLYTFAWLPSRDVGAAAASDPRLDYLPAARRAMMQAMVASEAPDADAQTSREAVFRARQRLVRTLHEHGVALLAGTDYAQYPLVFPGFSLHDELAQLVAAGLPPLDALRTATLNVGRYLNDRTVGCLDPGCRADIVFLDANPLADIAHVARVQAVVTRGFYLDPDARRARLESIRRGGTPRPERPAPPGTRRSLSPASRVLQRMASMNRR